MLERNRLAISALFVGLGSLVYSNLVVYFFRQSDSFFRKLHLLLSMCEGLHLLVMGATLAASYLAFRFEKKRSRYLLFSSVYLAIAIALLLIVLNTGWLNFLLPPLRSK